MTNIKTLITLANELDNMGLNKTADELDILITKIAMAIADIPPGEQIERIPHWIPETQPEHIGNVYNYSHILTPEQLNAGFSLYVQDVGMKEPKDARYYVWLYNKDNPIGDMDVFVKDNKLEPHSHIYIARYQNKGLGVKMYEAVYAQALKDGITTVKGGELGHSQDASKIHKRLMEKHQLSGYEEKTDPALKPEHQLAPYEYKIK